jgi:sugar lactone lactonase YvrE
MEERRIRFPADQVSSVTFGGENMDEIYVTTAGASDRKTHGNDAGALFRLRLGIRGLPEFFSNVCV